jgi:chromosome segregation ATPase/cytoskeletal protein CcmA (bactofilin family)
MTVLNTKPQSRGLITRAGALFRRRRNWLEIPGYHVGDIFSAEPVHVTATAAVAGDVVAPKVVVEGLLYGSVGAWEVAVAASGSIWGDIYAGAIEVEPGGKVQGWVSTVDEPTYQALLNGQSSLRALTAADEADLLADLEARGLSALLPNGSLVEPVNRLAILRRLQAEAGAAILARTELERNFDQRLSELADEALAEAATLRQDVTVAHDRLSAAQGQLQEWDSAVLQRDEQIAGYVAELAEVRDSLSHKSVALAKSNAVGEQQAAEIATLAAAREQLARQVEELVLQAEAMAEKLENRENALQGSLQRAADLEESLLRWQELADTTEKRAGDLEVEMKNVRLQAEESARSYEKMRAQRRKLQLAWDEASAEALSWKTRAGQLQEDVEELRLEGDEMRQRLSEQPPASDTLVAEREGLRAELLKMKGQAEALEKRLAGAEAEVQAYYDQLLWYKASLKTSTLELEQLQKQVAEQAAELEQLRTESGQRQGQVETWKTNIGRMTEMLYGAEERIRTLQAEVTTLKDQSEEEIQSLREALRQRQLQLEAAEVEVDGYYSQFEAQSNRLAEAQATLVEREVALNRSHTQAAAASHELAALKELAGKRIRTLEEELAQARRRLKDMVTFLERRRRRDERPVEDEDNS